MNYENFISYRYLIATKGRFLTFLNVISIAGVAIGVTALIVVIGVMTGFQNNLRDIIIGTTPHVMIEKETVISDYEKLQNDIKQIEAVKHMSPYVQGNIFLEDNGQALSMVVRGIQAETEANITKVPQYMIKGKLGDLKDNGIFIGSELARYFGYTIGDEITLIAPGSGIAGKGWRYQLIIRGIFKTGMAEYDMKLVLIDLKKAQEIFNYAENTVSGIGVNLANPYQAEEVKNRLYEMIGYSYLLRTWIDMNSNLFDALKLEKLGLFIVLTMIIIVAAFNIISTLIVTVTSKVHDIGILQAIGIPKKSIRKIFTTQGIFIGTLGIVWGLIGGFGLSYILKTYVEVPQKIYSIEHVPVQLVLSDILAIVVSALIISYLAAIYPAKKAADLKPVEALRYE